MTSLTELGGPQQCNAAGSGKDLVRANGLREGSIVQWRRVSVALDGLIVHNFVELVRGDAWLDVRGSDIEYFSSHLRGGVYSVVRGLWRNLVGK